MPSLLSTLQYVKPRELSEEEKKRIKRTRFFEGSREALLEEAALEEQKKKQAGLDAIAQLKLQMDESEEPDPERERAVFELENRDRLQSAKEKLRSSGDTEGLINFDASVSPVRLSHSLADTTALARNPRQSSQDVYQQGRQELFSSGLSENPEVAAFLKEHERIQSEKANAAEVEKVREQMNQLADQLPEGEGYDVLRGVLRSSAVSPLLAKVTEEALKQIGMGGQKTIETTQDIRKEGVMQEGRIGLEELKQKGDLNLERLKQQAKDDTTGVKGMADFDKKLRTDPVLRQNTKVLNAATDLYKMLNSNNAIAQDVIGTKMAKLSGEVGNLAIQEQIQYKGSQALMDKFSQSLVRAGTGKLSGKNKEYALELVSMFESTAKDAYDERINSITKGHAAQYQVDESTLRPISDAYSYKKNTDETELSEEDKNQGWQTIGGIKIRKKM